MNKASYKILKENNKGINNLAYAKKLSWKYLGNIFLFLFCIAATLSLGACAGQNSGKKESQGSISSSQSGENAQLPGMAENKPIKILFVGDMMFDRYIREAVEKRGGDYNYVFSEIRDFLAGYDLVVGNLEGPITDKKSVSAGTRMDDKKNFLFTFDPAVAKALAENNIKLVGLGNNHSLNQDADGLEQTKKYLAAAGVSFFGDTGGEEKRYLIKEINGRRFGFANYNYTAENGLARALDDIENIGKNSDVVIAYPHWGMEYKTGDPGQSIRDLGHKFVDAGADLVVGTHPHVIQASEVYKDKKIYYSLGNFVFDQYFQKETMEGLGIEVTIGPDLTLEYNEVKFVMNKKGQTAMNKEQ